MYQEIGTNLNYASNSMDLCMCTYMNGHKSKSKSIINDYIDDKCISNTPDTINQEPPEAGGISLSHMQY